MTDKIGQAYAFFNCNASKEDIEKEIPFIRECVKTPNSLELLLVEGPENLRGEDNLLQIASEAKNAGRRYAMQANYPNATNLATAGELVSILNQAYLNQAYQSPLYQEGEEFRGEVIYEERGEYLFKE